MNTNHNPQLKLAYDFVQYTGKNIFLTGKAGTGKTTFLHRLKESLPKRMIVVAPTGVAAINAGGVTIHSFFQLSFGPQVPGYEHGISGSGFRDQKAPEKIKRFSKEKINIIKSLDLLIIDEISMVRADLLDGIDQTLRRFRKGNLPFGGVQLLMIGDLQQLAPVVKEDEWNLLREHYKTPFFFSSKALQQTQYVSIELLHVYRQSDQQFINILNKVRDNKIDQQVIDTLNARFNPDFKPDDSGYITLTTHNARAKHINDQKLGQLSGKVSSFHAEVQGNFPEFTYPTDPELSLKTGSQVMFVKNDPSVLKQYYNGKIGTITEIDEEDGIIMVTCPDDENPIPVEPVEWQKMKYSLDENTKEIEETVEGTFTQYPLKLAWAITIHKSQGLTFEKAIIDAQAAFAHGQVYVALSRCKSLEGLVLSTKFSPQSVKSDQTVKSFTRNVEENQPDRDQLEESRKIYQEQLLADLFDFKTLQKQIYYALKVLKDNPGGLPNGVRDDFVQINQKTKEEISGVGEKFMNQLKALLSENGNVEKNPAIQERLQKAGKYFTENLSDIILHRIDNINIETDNKALKKSINDAINNILNESNYKLACLQACEKGFVIRDYLVARAKAGLEEAAPKRSRKKASELVSSEITRPELYKILKAWRDEKAVDMGLEVYRILQLKSMRDMCEFLPGTRKALKEIKGMGKKKLEMFGDELLDIVNKYREENNMEIPDPEEPEVRIKKPKIDTKKISYDLWKQGKSIIQIAGERHLTRSTIEGHLAHYVGTGEIPVTELVSANKLNQILDFFEKHKRATLNEAREVLGKEISYGELRIVLKHMEAGNY